MCGVQLASPFTVILGDSECGVSFSGSFLGLGLLPRFGGVCTLTGFALVLGGVWYSVSELRRLSWYKSGCVLAFPLLADTSAQSAKALLSPFMFPFPELCFAPLPVV